MCSNTGYFACSKEKMVSEFDEFGLGTVIYFKVVKSYIICFFIIFLINLPLYYIYTTSNSNTQISDYKDAIFRTSIGSISSSIILFMKPCTTASVFLLQICMLILCSIPALIVLI